MSFFTVEPDSGVQIFQFEGRITFGKEIERCRQTLRDLLASGNKKFVFDFSKVEYVDSAGVGFLVSCLSTLGSAGAMLRLVSVPDRVAYVLGITKLNTIFEILPARSAALKSF